MSRIGLVARSRHRIAPPSALPMEVAHSGSAGVKKVLGALLVLIASLLPDPGFATDNLALGKPYTLSRPPLYQYTRDAGDAVQLTDGQVTTGTMWLSPQAVGWLSNRLPIGVEIDLGQQHALDRVCVRTSRRAEAGVHYPRRIEVFLSQDRARYAWAGRATPFVEAGEGPYAAREFCAAPAGVGARYVRINVTPQGMFFMADEITVLGGRAGGGPIGGGAAPVAAIAADDVETFGLEVEALEAMASGLQSRLEAGRADRGLLDSLRRFRMQLSTSPKHGPHDLAEARLELGRILRLTRKPGQLTAELSDPWRLATPLDGAVIRSAAGQVDMARGWNGASAVAIAHGEAGPIAVAVSTVVKGPAATGLSVVPLHAELVTRADAVRMRDPLVTLPGNRLDVAEGEVRQLWLDITAAPDAPLGAATVEIVLDAELASGHVTRRIELPVVVHPRPESRRVASTTVWGYFDESITRGVERLAGLDMLAHGVDTAVIPVWHHLPLPKPGAKPSDAVIGDYDRYDKVMAALEGHRRYVFFLAYNADSSRRTFGRRHAFLSPEWSDLFVAWIKEWSGRLRAAGIGYDRFAFYPVDEPHPGPETEALIAVSRLIKKADPRIRVYTTLHEPKSLTDEVIAAVDEFQLNGAALNEEIISRLRARGKTVTLYSTDGGKAVDPASGYRALAWKAFVLGLDGYGFWSYADIGPKGTAWNDIDGARPDYAVVYDVPGRIVPSKRWRAWREGVQDHALLAAASQAACTDADRAQVRQLAELGLGRVADLSTLNDVRRQLFARVRTPTSRGCP